MASSPDGIPYGSRWGFRTPSPDFARTAVEPLSPPAYPTAASFAARPPPLSAISSCPPNAPLYPATAAATPPHPPVSPRSARSPDSALPFLPFSPGLMMARAVVEKQPASGESNRLDALAEIALLHGANRLPSAASAYSSAVLPPPPAASPPAPLATAATTPSWPRPDSASPLLVSTPFDTAPAESAGSLADPAREQSYGPIGYGRRSAPNIREYAAAPSAAVALPHSLPPPPPPLSHPHPPPPPPLPPPPTPRRRSSLPVSAVLAPPAVHPVRPVKTPLPVDPVPYAICEPKAPPLPSWVNSSPVDEYVAVQASSPTHRNSTTVRRSDPAAAPPIPCKLHDGLQDPRHVPVPTRTLDDHNQKTPRKPRVPATAAAAAAAAAASNPAPRSAAEADSLFEEASTLLPLSRESKPGPVAAQDLPTCGELGLF